MFHTPDLSCVTVCVIMRARSRMRAKVRSAVSSRFAPGVLVIVMPRRTASAKSMPSKPAPWRAMSLRLGSRSMVAASRWSLPRTMASQS